MPEDRAIGFFLDGLGRICVGFADRSIVFALTLEEMRKFAAALNEAADEIDARAGRAATEALARAGRPQ